MPKRRFLQLLPIAVPLVVGAQSGPGRWETLTQESRQQADRGRPVEALQAAEESLKELGSGHRPSPELVHSLNNLLCSLTQVGRYEEAERHGRRALEILRTLPADAGAEASIRNNLASLYIATGRFEEAERNHRQVLELLEPAPERHPEALAATRLGLGVVLLHRNRLGEAEQNLLSGMEVARRFAGDDVLSVAAVLLGELYTKKRRPAEAEAMFLESLSIREKSSGPEHPYVARPSFELARLYFGQRRYEEAESLCRRSITVLEKVSSDHPELAKPVDLYAKILQAQNRKREARMWDQRAKALAEAAAAWQRHTVSVTALTERR